MSVSLRQFPAALLVVLVAAMPWSPAQAQRAGQVLFVFDRATVERDGVVQALARGDAVQPRDVLRTGPTGLLQVRMEDGALIALKSATEFVIEEYRAPAQAPARAVPGAPPARAETRISGASAALRLVRGGFRTVTGLIGQVDRQEYRVATPVATIGIRGTDYSAAFCGADCRQGAECMAECLDVDPGLHVGVSTGGVALANQAGELVLGDDEYAYVASIDTLPKLRLVRPSVLALNLPPPDDGDADSDELDPPSSARDDLALASGSADGSGASEFEHVPPAHPDELRPGFGRSVQFSFAAGQDDGGSLTRSQPATSGDLEVDAAGALVAFPTNEGRYAIGTADHGDLGFDPATGLRWGRWAGGSASVGGSALDLSSQSLHWMYGPELDQAPAIALSGSASYRLVGNTNPTDRQGNVGFLGFAALQADFTNQRVFSELSLGISDQVWQASGSGNLLADTPLFSGLYDTVSVDGVLGGNGSFAGFFIPGVNDGDIPLGAGLNYSLSSGGNTVSGAAAFADPSSGP